MTFLSDYGNKNLLTRAIENKQAEKKQSIAPFLKKPQTLIKPIKISTPSGKTFSVTPTHHVSIGGSPIISKAFEKKQADIEKSYKEQLQQQKQPTQELKTSTMFNKNKLETAEEVLKRTPTEAGSVLYSKGIKRIGKGRFIEQLYNPTNKTIFDLYNPSNRDINGNYINSNANTLSYVYVNPKYIPFSKTGMSNIIEGDLIKTPQPTSNPVINFIGGGGMGTITSIAQAPLQLKETYRGIVKSKLPMKYYADVQKRSKEFGEKLVTQAKEHPFMTAGSIVGFGVLGKTDFGGFVGENVIGLKSRAKTIKKIKNAPESATLHKTNMRVLAEKQMADKQIALAKGETEAITKLGNAEIRSRIKTNSMLKTPFGHKAPESLSASTGKFEIKIPAKSQKVIDIFGKTKGSKVSKVSRGSFESLSKDFYKKINEHKTQYTGFGASKIKKTKIQPSISAGNIIERVAEKTETGRVKHSISQHSGEFVTTGGSKGKVSGMVDYTNELLYKQQQKIMGNPKTPSLKQITKPSLIDKQIQSNVIGSALKTHAKAIQKAEQMQTLPKLSFPKTLTIAPITSQKQNIKQLHKPKLIQPHIISIKQKTKHIQKTRQVQKIKQNQFLGSGFKSLQSEDQMQRQIQKNMLSQKSVSKQRQLQKQMQKQMQRQLQKQGQRQMAMPEITPPIIPSISIPKTSGFPIPFVFPSLKKAHGIKRKRITSKHKHKNKYGYAPDFASMMLGITTKRKPKKNKLYTGLEMRKVIRL